MIYKIAYKRCEHIYTEYVDINELTTILKFIERHLEDYQLVNITKHAE